MELSSQLKTGGQSNFLPASALPGKAGEGKQKYLQTLLKTALELALSSPSLQIQSGDEHVGHHHEQDFLMMSIL